MVKFCSNCGTQLNDEARFCAKCGSRIDDVDGHSSTQQNVNAGVFCGKCGALVPLGNTVCTSCGAPLNQDSHKTAIVLGYICAFLFHIVGIILGIYLLTRDNPDVKKHGAIIIEDAAESMGATYKGVQTGTFGNYNAISFNGIPLIVNSISSR